MITLTAGLSYFDLHFLDVKGIIATVVLHGPGGVALIDPGPSSTLPALRAALGGAGIQIADVRAILLTHIHLDHAGATGTLAAENPALRVYVHEKGAPHMVDPEKLIASATRLWPGEMYTLWGEFRPVPADRDCSEADVRMAHRNLLHRVERVDAAPQQLAAVQVVVRGPLEQLTATCFGLLARLHSFPKDLQFDDAECSLDSKDQLVIEII